MAQRVQVAEAALSAVVAAEQQHRVPPDHRAVAAAQARVRTLRLCTGVVTPMTTVT